MNMRFDRNIFKNAADAITSMRRGDEHVDLSPVVVASNYLDGYGKTLEEFERFDSVTRCFLRAGAKRISKKCTSDSSLLAVIREVVGATRDIRNANGKLKRAHEFLAELGATGG